MSTDEAQQPEVTEQPKPRRGWRRLFQFRILTLLILVTVVSGWLGWWSHRARQQREVTAVLHAAGGKVRYDFEDEKLDGPKYCPQWLVDWLGVDYFSNVKSVWFEHIEVTDDRLKHLKGLDSLERLSLRNSEVTDEGLKHLEGLTALKSLSLYDTQITDEGLKHLEGLTALGWLRLSRTQVTDEGLTHLEGLTALKQLRLIDTQVTDEGVARLQDKLPDCEIYH